MTYSSASCSSADIFPGTGGAAVISSMRLYGVGSSSSPSISSATCRGTENNITECMYTINNTTDNCNVVGFSWAHEVMIHQSHAI